MSTLFNFNYIIGCIAASLGFVVSFILFAINKEYSHSRKMLAGVIFCISLFSLTYSLVGTTFFLNFPHAWRLAAPFSGLMPPLLFFYVRSVLYQEFRFRPNDFLFFIPAVLMIIHFLPFYMLSGDEKREIILKMLSNKKLALLEIDGIFPSGFGMLIRSLTGVLFTLLAIFELYQHKTKTILKGVTYQTRNQEVYKWLYFLLSCIAFSIILLIFWNFLAISSKIEFSFAISFTTTGLILVISMYLFLKPTILYGFQGWANTPGVLPDSGSGYVLTMNSQIQDSDISSFSAEMREEISSAIENHFKHNRPFIAPGYKIKDLSLELNIPVYLISSFINQEYGKNFNEFINDHRLAYISDMLVESPDSQNFTLEALAKSAGFNTRNTFIVAVKKKYGKTPSAYYLRKLT